MCRCVYVPSKAAPFNKALTEVPQQRPALDEAEQLLVVRHHGVGPERVLAQKLHELSGWVGGQVGGWGWGACVCMHARDWFAAGV